MLSQEILVWGLIGSWVVGWGQGISKGSWISKGSFPGTLQNGVFLLTKRSSLDSLPPTLQIENIFMKIKSIFFFKKIFRKIYFFRGEVLEAYSSRLPWVTQGAYIFVKKKWKENSKRKIALIIQRTQTFMLFSAQKNYKITKPQV